MASCLPCSCHVYDEGDDQNKKQRANSNIESGASPFQQVAASVLSPPPPPATTTLMQIAKENTNDKSKQRNIAKKMHHPIISEMRWETPVASSAENHSQTSKSSNFIW